MVITWGLENASHNPKTITTQGSYDGVHLGHRRILERLRARKKEFGLDRSLLLTFHPHPQEVLRKSGSPVELLTTIDERLELLEKQGIDEVVVIEFTREFSQTSYLDFFRKTIVEALGSRAMVVGFNHAFGKNREGDADHLKKIAREMDILVEEIPPVTVGSISISSSKIRLALKTGDMVNANAWLGRPYPLTGRVVHGDSLGKTLGFPTANLEIDPVKLIPADGVYAARAVIRGKNYLAALSIGSKPTIRPDGERTVEALLLDFDGDLYSEELRVECLGFLRPQEAFSSLDELKQAIGRDVAVIRQIEAHS
ncbi:MAG TPA: bifunctional riboflavin kinase/FAD synthetase [Candidatus Kapabacteria bacterium]|nr:bifunctional riboflavin kinase/FAD synthetase [Candidatus Kapabacteria bacterium]